ncbi:MAG: DUF3038 domain-containing protein [Gloeomargarita sp. GMQP_bins_120]
MMTESLTTEPDGLLALQQLPDPQPPLEHCPPAVAGKLDLLLLAVEALDYNAAEWMVMVVKELELTRIIPNRVTLWQLRGANPLRRIYNRRLLTLSQARALVLVLVYMAKRLTILIRQLLLAAEQLQQHRLSLAHHPRLDDYCRRFRNHFRKRMNLRRERLQVYREDERLNLLAMDLLVQLLFCTGTCGAQRLWASLFVGEVL